MNTVSASSFTFPASAPLTLNAKLLPLNGWNLKPTLAGGAGGIYFGVPLEQKLSLSWRYPIATSGHKSEEWPFSVPPLMRDLCFPGGQRDGLILGPAGNSTKSHRASSNISLTSGETPAEQRWVQPPSKLTARGDETFMWYFFECSLSSVDPHCGTRARLDCSCADLKFNIEQLFLSLHSGRVQPIDSLLV